MLHLTLLRHAKSGWDDPDLDDHDRPLTKRGTRAATKVGHYLATHDLLPELIVCSDAIRTQATRALMLAAAAPQSPPVIVTTADLYLASPEWILTVVQREAGNAQHVMVIGHNPGLHMLALELSGQGKPKALAELAMKFPTAALAHIECDVSAWADIEPARCRIERFVRPRDL